MAVGIAVVALGTGALSPPVLATPPIPTFADVPTSTPTSVRAAPGALPGDCGAVLSPDMVTALAGWPLGGTQVRTLHDVPAPRTGRTARMSCSYRRVQAPGEPSVSVPDDPVLGVVIASFTDPSAARAQAGANAAAETPTGPTRAVDLGAAHGTWYPEDGDELLALTYDRFTVDITVTDALTPAPSAEAFAGDLALRALATLTPASSPASGPTSTGAVAARGG